jgi:hypothetical protein
LLHDLSRCAAVALACALCGCGSAFQYFGDPDPGLEQGRYVYVKYHPGDEYNNEILAGRVRPGMNRDEVRASWGEPHDVAAATDTRVDEEWLYRDLEPSRGNQFYVLSFDKDLLAKVAVIRHGLLAPTNSPRAEAEEIDEPETDGKRTTP